MSVNSQNIFAKMQSSSTVAIFFIEFALRDITSVAFYIPLCWVDTIQ